MWPCSFLNNTKDQKQCTVTRPVENLGKLQTHLAALGRFTKNVQDAANGRSSNNWMHNQSLQTDT